MKFDSSNWILKIIWALAQQKKSIIDSNAILRAVINIIDKKSTLNKSLKMATVRYESKTCKLLKEASIRVAFCFYRAYFELNSLIQ